MGMTSISVPRHFLTCLNIYFHVTCRTYVKTHPENNLTFSMVVQACLSGVVKQSGSGPPSRQIFDSISIRTESPKPRGLVAWSEKYLERKIKQQTTQVKKVIRVHKHIRNFHPSSIFHHRLYLAQGRRGAGAYRSNLRVKEQGTHWTRCQLNAQRETNKHPHSHSHLRAN